MRSSVTFLGHSGLDVRFGVARIVCDPWLSPRGSHLGNWHQFPDNSHLRAESLHDTPHLYISHPHQDHFDVDTLRAFPKTPRVVIPAFPSRTFREQLRQLGFDDVVELRAWEPRDIGGGATIRLIAEPSRHILDSTLVIEAGGVVFVNQNDCYLDGPAIERLAALRPLFHFVQFSGASYFPAIYDFRPEQMKGHVDRYSKLLFKRFFDAALGVGARYVIPSAGPPCFFGDKDFPLNFGGSIFFDADDLVAQTAATQPQLLDRIRLLYPGDIVSEEADGWHFQSRKPYDDKRRYLEDYRRRREPERERYLAELRAQAQPVDVRSLRAYLRELFKYEDMIRDMDLLVEFRLLGGPSMWVDFRERPVRFLESNQDAAAYSLTLESAWMSLIMQGKVNWYDLLMSHQVTLRREPDRYCVGLMNHLYYRHDPALFELVRQLGSAEVTVADDEMEYVCQKFCPHLGRDLSSGTVVRGVLTCPAHGWAFDLRAEGKCVSGGGASVAVKEARPLAK